MLIAAERSEEQIDSIIDDDYDVAAATITAGLLAGVALADGRNRKRRQAFVDQVLGTIPLEDYDLDAARAHAELLTHVRKTGRPRGAHDLIIAATAVARNRTVVTRNHSDFEGLPGVSVKRESGKG